MPVLYLGADSYADVLDALALVGAALDARAGARRDRPDHGGADGRPAAGMSVIVVLHDLLLAARHADRVAALSDGRLRADGPLDAVFRSELLHEVFGIEMTVMTDPTSGRPLPVPGRGHGPGAHAVVETVG